MILEELFKIECANMFDTELKFSFLLFIQGGVFLFQLMDFYSCSGLSLLWVCFFQTIAIGWFFGADRFCDCVEQMTGHKPGLFWFLCWKYFAPAVMFAVFVFYVISYEPVTYGKDYEYPKWGEMMGLCMSFASMMWVPIYAIYYVLTQPGTIVEVCVYSIFLLVILFLAVYYYLEF